MDAHAIGLRKKILIAEGKVLRYGVAEAAVQVKTGIQPSALVQAGGRIAGAAALGMLGAPSPLVGIGLQTLVPMLLRGASSLSKRLSKQSLGKPLVRGVAVAVVFAGIAAMLFKRKKTRPEND
jgi:hypothetical protein